MATASQAQNTAHPAPRRRVPRGRGRAGDRLALTLFVAIVVHAMVILGISFVPEDAFERHTPTLDVTLVQQSSDEAPEDAEKIAQANQKGGGEAATDSQPSSPVAGPKPEPSQGVAPRPMERATPQPKPEPQPEQPVVTSQEAPEQTPDEPEPKPEQRKVDADTLVSRSMQMASMTSQLEPTQQRRSERPRERFVTARTREHLLAGYIEGWVNKVERIGNLNYPEAARRQRLSGSLLLDVALNADGSVREITCVRSSGHKVLDDAAMRIVRLAAPFSPFPKDVKEETDVLHIIRTWRFTDQGSLVGTQ